MEHKEAQVYSAGAKYCDLCLTEKTIIMLADKKKAVSTSNLRFSESVHISVNLPWVWSNPDIPPSPPADDGEG